ncbi:MAG TPA: branched-chain-amino-acid transaminase [Candidatus Omnitrophota bacterium]|nr:branched-chain-amino-acid transaminase [Candidatus Omnitrophota bacterium]
MGIKIFLNGNFVDKEKAVVSVFDHGLLYGDGVFEGIRSYKRRVFRLDKHMDRLYSGAGEIGLEIPMTKGEFTGKVTETLKVNDLDDAYIRVVVTRGAGDLGLDPRKCKVPTVFIIADKIKLYPEEMYRNGMPITIAKTRRNHPAALNPRIKSLNYLNNILARIEAIKAGVEEALMLSIDGHVVECTGDNIFIVKGGKIRTPLPELGALKGVTQEAVLELARGMGIDTDYRALMPEDLFSADECFLTGTAAEVIPVVEIDGKKIGPGRPGDVTGRLIKAYHELTSREGVPY